MPGKNNDISAVTIGWQAYQELQSRAHVLRRCVQAGHRVHPNTVTNWIHRGVPSAGILPFKEQIAKLRGRKLAVPARPRKPKAPKPKPRKRRPKPKPKEDAKAVQVLAKHESEWTEENRPPLQVTEVQVAEVVDLRSLEVAVAQLDQWRKRVDSSADVVDMLLARAREVLVGKKHDGEPVPMDPKELQQASNAVKVAFDAMKKAAETHEILRVMSGTDADGRDTWMQEWFSGWSREEHEAFRQVGKWPERLGPPPAFMAQDPVGMLEPEPRDWEEEDIDLPDLPEPEDSTGVEFEEGNHPEEPDSSDDIEGNNSMTSNSSDEGEAE